MKEGKERSLFIFFFIFFFRFFFFSFFLSFCLTYLGPESYIALYHFSASWLGALYIDFAKTDGHCRFEKVLNERVLQIIALSISHEFSSTRLVKYLPLKSKFTRTLGYVFTDKESNEQINAIVHLIAQTNKSNGAFEAFHSRNLLLPTFSSNSDFSHIFPKRKKKTERRICSECETLRRSDPSNELRDKKSIETETAFGH